MKQLRILTGNHAGVHLELTSTRYVIGADDEADIQLLDWRSGPVVIEVTEEQVVSIALNPGNLFAVQADEAERLDDFAPRRIGDIVLCVGPLRGAWPSDLDLIGRLHQPALAAPAADTGIGGNPGTVGTLEAAAITDEKRGRKVGWMLSALLGTVMMTAAFSATVARLTQNGPAGQDAQDMARNPVPVPLKTRVERTISELAMPGLDVVQNGDQVTVRGMVRGATEAAALQARLQALKSTHIVHAYASAADVARDITDALGLPGIAVAWRGDGVFVVTGQALDLERLKDAASRVRGDFGQLVRRIDVAATEQARASSSPISAAMQTGGLQYVQTRDGVKHLSMSDAAASLAEPSSAAGPGRAGELPLDIHR